MQAKQWWQVLGLAVLLLFLCKMSVMVLDQELHQQHFSVGSDTDASLARLPRNPSQDKRGWLLDPLKAAAQAGLSAVHAGEIQVGAVRANHRHHFCNETFLLWNARALFRLENAFMDNGYAQAVVGAGEVSIAAAPAGRAHALANIDRHKTLFFLACQDALFNPENPMTDFRIWDDL
ncbi:uncharacterized protein LOC112342763 [Selaginella moellendorffii]|uniref:uncharacterized protein LOC112342763 n=1 Tax=Selaginella moellendorffii TaxID=88036 RepID=UPI000D1CEF7B|nr:uncharacterized protein LOC112342763 [Selaginella moellendorffii]|eukprot:XP_024520830.1 uncharacterized protein LOC112342763 [Selaginella moellendorffii]